ncbi:MAG: efflux RND transporter periplasmic adaptor subunit [Halobacteria archaeon]|nr:efflux RND transporter periplasmic adaptor subunit [Halobacteria archaeon]
MKNHITTSWNMEQGLGLALFIFLYFAVSVSVSAFELEAELDWARQVELGTPVRGVVQRVMAKPGQRVKQGEVLLLLDQRGFKSQVAGLKAQLEHLKAELAEARREQDRSLELYDRTVLSDHELQVAKNNFIAAKAKYHKGQADLVQAELDLEYSSVRAPFDAVIIARQAEVGQVVVPDLKPIVLFVVADANHMHAKSRLTSKQLAKVAIDQEAMVKIDDETFNGRVISIGQVSEADNQSGNRYFLLKVEFPVQIQKLYSGQAAVIILP